MRKSLSTTLAAMLVFSAADAAIAVNPMILSCQPVQPTATAGSTIDYVCTIRSDATRTVRGVNFDFSQSPACFITPENGTGTMRFVQAFRDDALQNPPKLFVNGITVFSLNPPPMLDNSCFAAVTAALLVPYPEIPPNQTRYLLTARFQLSDDASGVFRVPFHSYSNPPHNNDTTKVRLPSGITIGILIAFKEIPNHLTVKPLPGCNSNAECADELFCNGAELCVSRECQSGPLPCNETQTCDEALDQCVFVPHCPSSRILASVPPSGAIDARQPHPIDDSSAAARQGIGSAAEPIQLSLGVTGADAACFAFCETAADPSLGANGIANISESSEGVYHIVLLRPITTGAGARIRYAEGDDGDSVVLFSHPANANADSASSAVDIIRLIDILNGVQQATFGALSSDINRSGQTSATDILALIDLLNGAGLFDPWNGVSQPTISGCP